MKPLNSLPSVGTKVTFRWDDTKLTGVVSSHEQCADGHVEVTVVKARKKADVGVYVMKVADLTIKA